MLYLRSPKCGCFWTSDDLSWYCRESAHAGRDGRDHTEGDGDVHEGVGDLLREHGASATPQRHQPRVQPHQTGKLCRVTKLGMWFVLKLNDFDSNFGQLSYQVSLSTR